MDDIVLKMRRPPCPCEGCVPPSRHIGCHGQCGDFIGWRAECDALYETIKKAKGDELEERKLRQKRVGWSKGANYR